MEGLGQTVSIKDQVIRLAKLTKEAGLDGVVASPQEAKFIREACGEDFLIITPGVRPAGASIDYCEPHTCDFNHELGEQNSQRI